MMCPGADQIADYVEGRLPAASAATIERHLIACSGCLAQVRQERELLDRMRAMPVQVPGGRDLVAGLLSLAPAAPSAPARPTSHRRCPTTLATNAPAQYVSARRSIAYAALVAAGCATAAVVAVHVPLSDSNRSPAETRPALMQQLSPRSAQMIGYTPVVEHTAVPQPFDRGR